MEISTVCVHGNGQKDQTGAVSTPIYQSATFCHPAVGQSTGYDYSRLQNPTREQLENTMALLENGVDAIAFSSGMAAISNMMELFSPNDHIIVSDDIYGGTHRLFSHVSVKNQIDVDFVDTSDISEISSHIKDNTRAIFIETPTNPMMKVSDISEIARIAKINGLITIVDNTFLTPYFQRPIELGADIVVHSATKYLGGHNDTLAGILVVANMELSQKLRFISKTIGSGLSPFDSWLIQRGIKTLPIRMEKSQQNAKEIALWLYAHPKIKKVYYTGLENHPGHAICKKQASGFGAMISFEVDCVDTATKLLEKVNLILYAESLGGVETLITYPMLQTHADVPVDIREAQGINNKFLRLSVGIEALEDIISDLSQALDL